MSTDAQKTKEHFGRTIAHVTREGLSEEPNPPGQMRKTAYEAWLAEDNFDAGGQQLLSLKRCIEGNK